MVFISSRRRMISNGQNQIQADPAHVQKHEMSSGSQLMVLLLLQWAVASWRHLRRSNQLKEVD